MPVEATAGALCHATHDLVIATAPLDHPTDSTVPRHYKLSDGRVLTEDRYRDQLAIGDTPLGHALLLAVPRIGWLVVTGDGHGGVSFSDIDPHAPKLRELFHTASGPSYQVVGTLDGAIALLVRQLPDPHAQLTCISGPGDVTRLTLDLPLHVQVPEGDAIRDHRLIVEDWPAAEPGWDKPFAIGAAILDLATGKRRGLGTAHATWTRWTDEPHPTATVWWSDDPRASASPGDTALTTVDVRSERLVRVY